jgi:sugar phosphate isomerase/epimerase
VELSDRLFSTCSDKAIETFQQACTTANCQIILDINTDLTFADPERWQQEIDHARQMLTLAHRLNARVTRICLGGQSLSLQTFRSRPDGIGTGPGSPGRLKQLLFNERTLALARTMREQTPAWIWQAEAKIERAIAALREIVPLADALRLPIAIENHWGISARPDYILQVVEAIASPYLGTCPDFGNFPRNVNRYQGIAQMAPRALHVQAKSWQFDDQGEETRIDYRRVMQILRDHHYSGAVAIEFEGTGDELAGIDRTRELIRKYW